MEDRLDIKHYFTITWVSFTRSICFPRCEGMLISVSLRLKTHTASFEINLDFLKEILAGYYMTCVSFRKKMQKKYEDQHWRHESCPDPLVTKGKHNVCLASYS